MDDIFSRLMKECWSDAHQISRVTYYGATNTGLMAIELFKARLKYYTIEVDPEKLKELLK